MKFDTKINLDDDIITIRATDGAANYIAMSYIYPNGMDGLDYVAIESRVDSTEAEDAAMWCRLRGGHLPSKYQAPIALVKELFSVMQKAYKGWTLYAHAADERRARVYEHVLKKSGISYAYDGDDLQINF